MTTDTETETPTRRAQRTFDRLIEVLCSVNRHRFIERCTGCAQCDALLNQYRDAVSAYDTAISDWLH